MHEIVNKKENNFRYPLKMSDVEVTLQEKTLQF